jgi:hypothetical protein
MTERAELQMFFHGAVVLFVGFLFGFGIADTPGDAGADFWRVAHSGLVAGGVWSIATGAAARRLALDGRGIVLLAWSVVVANYGFIFNGFARAAASGSDDAGGPLDWLVLGSFALASVASLLAAGLTIVGAFRALRAQALRNGT